MIKHHEKFRIPDLNKDNNFVIEVNWDPYNKEANDCKLARITFPGGQTAVVRTEHLHAVLFAIGNAEQQRNLIPEQVTRIRNYETTLGITASKDIRKGDKINVRVKIPIPLSQEDVLAGGKTKV